MNGRRPMNPHSKNHRLPPLFYLMEVGDWERAAERAKKHPREVTSWASLRTKYTAPHKISSAKRLALHHACFKLRSAVNTTVSADGSTEDPFLQVCRFILTLVELYPDAASMRESRHGCLPLHLAAFASCTRPSSSSSSSSSSSASSSPSSTRQAQQLEASLFSPSSFSSTSMASAATAIHKNMASSLQSPSTVASSRSPSSAAANQAGCSAFPFSLARPANVARDRRSVSESTSDTIHSNMTNMMEQEYMSGSQQQNYNGSGSGHNGMQPCKLQRSTSASTTSMNVNANSPRNNVSVSMGNNILVSEKRETMAVRVLNALLDAYPKGIRMDSEGGRLPLHMACAGRATPRVISTLVTAYPAAARHRNKDGFLPLHVAAHWGIAHPNVAINLLKAYPDATFGRNRWERTPLEEALCMAGENGRPHQSALVRSLRKHPSYWTRPSDLFQSKSPRENQRIVDTDETIPSNEDDSFEGGEARFYNPEGELFKGKVSLFGKKSKELDGEGVEPMSHLVDDLPTLIRNQNWESVLRRLEYNPDDADEELRTTTRGGFVAGSGFLPLHYACERRPPAEIVESLIQACPGAVMTRAMPGGCLPLHTACTWFSPRSSVNALLMADKAACKIQDELGNTPLHCACFSGTSVGVIEALLIAYPKSVLSRNHQGSLPEDIVDRLRHDNRQQVLHMLARCKDDVTARKQQHQQHRSSKSTTDRLAEYANRALDLDTSTAATPPPQSGDAPEEAFEVAYKANGDDLVWV